MGDELDIEALKTKHGKIFKVSFTPDDVFYVRRLKRAEHRRIDKLTEEQPQEERGDFAMLKIVETTLLWPKKDNWDDDPSGYVPMLSNKVLELSGFTQNILTEPV
jgi:hypothetical protein